MIRTIVKPNKNSITLSLPDDLVGKMVEVIAFSIDDIYAAVKKPSTKKARVADLIDKLKALSHNSGGYRFDRDDANDYE